MKKVYGLLIALLCCFMATTSVFANETFEICSAAYRGDIKEVERLINGNPGLIRAQSKVFGKMPIHYAAGIGNKDMVRFLLSRGATAEDRDNFGTTPLHEAATYGKGEVVEYLLSSGGNVNTKTKIGWTPLHYASAYGYENVAAILLARGADKLAMDDSGATPLHVAAENGYIGVAEVLLQNGVDVNSKSGTYEMSPLHCAVIGERREMVEYLIMRGADTAAKDMGGNTPLDWAFKYRNSDIITIIRSYEKKGK